MKYTFRNYNDNDYNLIYDLKKQAYQKYVKHFWGLWDDEKQHEFFDNYIKNQKDKIKIVVLDDKDIGYFDDNLCGNKYEVVNIILKPEYQGKGIGTEILKNAIKEHLKNEIHIQCFKTNPVKNLYFKLGFEEIEQTKTHIKMKLNKEKFITYENGAKCSAKKEGIMKNEIRHTGTTELETKRLLLRAYTIDDVEQLVEGLNEFDVAKGLVTPFPYTTEDGKAFILKNLNPGKNGKYNFAVIEKETGRLIGGTGVEVKEGNVGSGGIWLNKNYHKEGFGTEIYLARSIFAFNYLGVKELKSSYYDYNVGSKHLHEKVGFVPTGEEATAFNHALGRNVREIMVRLSRERFEQLDIYKDVKTKVTGINKETQKE